MTTEVGRRVERGERISGSRQQKTVPMKDGPQEKLPQAQSDFVGCGLFLMVAVILGGLLLMGARFIVRLFAG